jgi:hypothetical protein
MAGVGIAMTDHAQLDVGYRFLDLGTVSGFSGVTGTSISQRVFVSHRLGRISYKVLVFYGIEFTTQIGAVFAEPHWPAQPAMIGYTL